MWTMGGNICAKVYAPGEALPPGCTADQVSNLQSRDCHPELHGSYQLPGQDPSAAVPGWVMLTDGNWVWTGGGAAPGPHPDLTGSTISGSPTGPGVMLTQGGGVEANFCYPGVVGPNGLCIAPGGGSGTQGGGQKVVTVAQAAAPAVTATQPNPFAPINPNPVQSGPSVQTTTQNTNLIGSSTNTTAGGGAGAADEITSWIENNWVLIAAGVGGLVLIMAMGSKK